MIFKRVPAVTALVLLVASTSLVSAYIYSQQTSYVTQTIKNKPYYYVNQLSNVDSLVDCGTHSNFTAQRYDPDSSFDSITEENLGGIQIIPDYVDNNLSDADSSGNKATESNFTAQQYGPDSVSDTLTEVNVAIAKVGTDTSGTGNSLALSFSHTLEAGSNRLVVVYAQAENWADIDISGITYGGTAMTKAIDGETTSSGFYILVEIWYLLEVSLGSTGSKTVSITYSGAASSLEVNGFCAEYANVKQAVPEATDSDGSTISATVTNNVSPSTGAWVLSAVGCGQPGSYTHSSPQTEVLDYSDSSSQFAVAELRGGNGETSESSTWSGTSFNRQHRVCASWAPANNYELDLEVQWTNVDFSQAYEYLCIFGGTMGAEDIRVDVWNGSSWVNLFTDLSASWNNITVSSYLTSSTFTIRFKGGSETGDTTQDSWNIDATFLNVWTPNIQDFVDNNTSNVDSSPDKGTHSNFSAQQSGPDSINDVLTESAVTQMTIAASWGADVSSGGTKYPNDGSDWVGYSSGSYRTANKFPLADLPSGANVTKVEVIFTVSQAGGSFHLLDLHPYNGNGQADPQTDSGYYTYARCAAGTEYVNDDTSCRTTGVKTIDLGSQACADVMNAKTAVGFFSLGWHEEGDNTAYAALAEYADAINPPKLRVTCSASYELDLEAQWTNVDFSQAYEYLCIYGGTMGAEDIRVDVWNGSSWANLFTDLSAGWNNITVSSYLTSSTFTIRFKGGSETGDTTQDSWNIDATFLNVGAQEKNYKLDLEVQWINVDFSEANEQLCIYGGAMGSESLRVDVWNGMLWQNVFASLNNGWNNVTISAYLVSSTFTIRFKGSIESADASQNSWNIDATLIHVWT